MDMSISSCDVLNSFEMPTSSKLFNVKYQATAASEASAAAKTAEKSVKKRKRIATSEIQNTAYHMQLAIDQLMLALTKETEQSKQTKIEFVLAKAQHILLNNASFEFDSQLDIQHQIQAIQTDITVKFQEIKNSIADLRFVNLPAANQLAIAEPASQPTAAATTTIAAAKNAEKQSKTATKTATKTAEKSASKSYAQIAVADNQEQNWQLVQNKKKTATAANKTVNTKSAAASYREKRLILLESKNQEIDSMKIRNQINQELEKQLKLAANKPVLAAITKSQIQQNIVLTTTDNYNADFLIQHEKIWSKFFKYAITHKDFVWHKIVAHGIPTDIFNCSKGLDLLKQEIEIYNNMHPIAVNWLSTSQNRQEKMHASAVIAFDSEEAVQKALKKRLLIADISIKTAVFEAKDSKQCLKCQKLDHVTIACKNKTVCQFCSLNHSTRLHICKICEVVKSICIHTALKCDNCADNHAANSKECTLFAAKKSDSNSDSNHQFNAEASSILTSDSNSDDEMITK